MSKYHSQKTQAGGRLFDSKAEANRYKELTLLMQAGEITDIECQPKFLLQDGFRKNGKKHQAIHYIADFKITYKDGHVEIEDVKGVKTEAFRIKHKMFEKMYPELTLKIV